MFNNQIVWFRWGDKLKCKKKHNQQTSEERTSHPINDIIITDWWKLPHKNIATKLFFFFSSVNEFTASFLCVIFVHVRTLSGWFWSSTNYAVYFLYAACCFRYDIHIHGIPLKWMLLQAHAQSAGPEWRKPKQQQQQQIKFSARKHCVQGLCREINSIKMHWLSKEYETHEEPNKNVWHELNASDVYFRSHLLLARNHQRDGNLSGCTLFFYTTKNISNSRQHKVWL